MNVRDAIKHSVCCAFAPLGLALALAPSPGAHAAEQRPLAPLKYFVGHWTCAGHFTNGKPVQSHDQVSSELAGHWIRVQHVEDPPSRWRADEWWGYDKVMKHFTVVLFDNFDNTRHYLSSGWVGNVLTLENTAVKGFIDRFVFERRSGTEYRVVYSYRKDAGAWHVGDEQVCKREGSSPSP